MSRGILLVVALFGLSIIADAKPQNITVKGTTICHKKRIARVVVQLWERDKFDPDDLLAEVQSDEMGDFHLFGKEDEITTISPYIVIKHSCDAKEKCLRIAEYDVPQSKVGSTYDMTYVPVNIHVTGEKTKCK